MRAHSGTEILRIAGEKLLMPYHRPAGPEGRRFPAVLFLHGFPGLEKSVDVQRALMARGIASLAPSFLGAWGSGGTYRFTTLASQARAALAAMRGLAYVDARRTAVFGFSMGGWAALNMAAREPKLKAVVAVSPAGGADMVGPHTTDLLSHLSQPLRTIALKALVVDLKRAVAKGDSDQAAARIKAPLLLVHGAEDEIIPPTVSRRIAKSAGGPVRLVIERGAGHDFLDHREKLTRVCASFLARHLAAAFCLLALGPCPARAQAFAGGDFAAALRMGLAEARVIALSQNPDAAPDAKTPAEVRLGVEASLNGRVPAAYVDKFFSDSRLRVIDGIIGNFAGGGGSMPYEQYRDQFINPRGLAAGASFLAEQGVTLSTVSARFGVDAHLLAALAGVETRFGAYTGKLPVGAALWTIARKVPRRSDWAVREIAELLVFFFAEDEDAHLLRGSYAGAFGLVQFMPSSANAYAVDFNGDGKRRFYEWPDALASAANYLFQHGYRAGEPFTPASAVGRSIFAYNHSEYYVRVVLDLRAALLKSASASGQRAH